MNMITMYKANRTKDVPENDVKGQIGNGWSVNKIDEGKDKPVKATLRPVKKNAEDTPAVEEFSSEQGGDDKANLKGEENE